LIMMERELTTMREELVAPEPIQLSSNKDELTWLQQRADWIKGNRVPLAAGAGVLVGGPMLFGLAQGLDLREAAMYAFLQVTSLGAAIAPDAEFTREFTRAIAERNGPEITNHVQQTFGYAVESYKKFLESGVSGGVVAASIVHLAKLREERRTMANEGKIDLYPKGEQMIVLAGNHSFVADALMSSQYRHHVVPIFETAIGSGAVVAANPREVRNLHGVFLNLNISESTGLSYSKTPEWERLHLKRENLIRAKNGRRYLMVVGCGEGSENELSFNSDDVDVSQYDLRIALKKLYPKIAKDLVAPNDIIDVYIGNGAIEWDDIEYVDKKKTDRAIAAATGVDIYVDTRTLVFDELADTLRTMGAENVKLSTTAKIERSTGFRKDASEYIKRVPGCEHMTFDQAANGDSVWVMYHEKSEETFVAARTMRKMYPNRKIIALISSYNTQEFLETGDCEDVQFISISTLIADRLIQIREHLREGMIPSDIQKLLDRYLPEPPMNELEVNREVQLPLPITSPQQMLAS
jgi:hypothetical protein